MTITRDQDENIIQEADNTEHDHKTVHRDYMNLRNKSTAEVLKTHQGMSRIDSKYTAAEVGGKQGLIASILHHRHGEKRVNAYFDLPAGKRKSLPESEEQSVNEPLVETTLYDDWLYIDSILAKINGSKSK
jgi:hypothetical protein